MNWTQVESSQIAEVGYEQPTRTLGIRFKAKGKWPASEYHYSNVPAPIHRAMLGAESVGHFFESEIKLRPDLYPYQKQGEMLPPKPEPVDSALMKVDRMTAAEIFIPGNMDPILVAIREEVTRQAAEIDKTTTAGLKQLGSLAYKVTKSKTFIESQRKSLVAAEKKRLQAIDTEGRRIWDILEGIADEVRKPLTDWEQIDKDRKARLETTLLELLDYGKVHYAATAEQIKEAIDRLNAIDTSAMEEYSGLAASHKSNSLKELNAALTAQLEIDKAKAENERLKAEAQERETQERAISAARFAREAAEKEAEAERQRLLAEKQEAEDRAAAAERRAMQAVEEERARTAEAKAKEAAETEKRERNKKHRNAINGGIEVFLISIMEECESTAPADFAKAIIAAVSSGNVPNLSIQY